MLQSNDEATLFEGATRDQLGSPTTAEGIQQKLLDDAIGDAAMGHPRHTRYECGECSGWLLAAVAGAAVVYLRERPDRAASFDLSAFKYGFEARLTEKHNLPKKDGNPLAPAELAEVMIRYELPWRPPSTEPGLTDWIAGAEHAARGWAYHDVTCRESWKQNIWVQGCPPDYPEAEDRALREKTEHLFSGNWRHPDFIEPIDVMYEPERWQLHQEGEWERYQRIRAESNSQRDHPLPDFWVDHPRYGLSVEPSGDQAEYEARSVIIARWLGHRDAVYDSECMPLAFKSDWAREEYEQAYKAGRKWKEANRLSAPSEREAYLQPFKPEGHPK